MRNKETERIGKEIRKLCGDKPFQPFAAYFEDWERIYVLVKDCSVTHREGNGILTLLEDNYPEKEEDKYVGFIIEYVRGFCLKQGLLSEHTVQLSAILDTIAVVFPEDAAIVDNIARPLLKKFSLDSVTFTL